MKCLLLALSLALVCGVQAIDVLEIMKHLDIQKLAGTWHSMAMAASTSSLLEVQSSSLRVFISALRPTLEGNLEIFLQAWEDNRCVEKRIFAEKTESLENFQINYLGENRLMFLDTDYDDHLFFCMENIAAPSQSLVCQYLARTLRVDEQVMERFSNAVKTLSVPMPIFLDVTRGGALPRPPGGEEAP
ncbi:glycodelin [Nycticebus coucang]|uniref:glycodelin n=1 Tax=Nycticebus coucang TaxID=9470 RepID=UPI00234E067C|nr:glycodelin [Nycticebus coucang]